MFEHWRDIEGYEGKYQVSTKGRVRSLNYHRGNNTKILSAYGSKNRYCKVVLYKDSKPKTITVHRLVMETFVGKAPKEKPCVDHIDGNIQNNSLGNLRFVSYHDNLCSPIRISRFKNTLLKKKGLADPIDEDSAYFKEVLVELISASEDRQGFLFITPLTEEWCCYDAEDLSLTVAALSKSPIVIHLPDYIDEAGDLDYLRIYKQIIDGLRSLGAVS